MSEVECEEIKRDYSGTSGSGARIIPAAIGDGTGDRRCYFTRTVRPPSIKVLIHVSRNLALITTTYPFFFPCGCEIILCDHYGSLKKASPNR